MGGLSGTKTVGMLNQAEVAQLCNDAYARYSAKIPKATTCKWDALDFASSTSAQSDDKIREYCTMQETTCTGKADPWAMHPDCSDPPMGCAVTIDEYFKCIDDMVMPFTQTVTGLPMCSVLKTSDTAAIIAAKSGGTPPASCSALTTKCQDLTIPGPID